MITFDPTSVCSLCGEKSVKRSLCNRHYIALRRAGLLPPVRDPSRSPLERFVDLVAFSDSCWNWTGAINKGGYGNFYFGGRYVSAHRFSYEALVGVIPDGLQIDHLCRNRACVRPEHLEAVTPQTNILRGFSPSADGVRRGTCSKGHPFHIDQRGRRRCRPCHAAQERIRRAERPC